MTREELKAKLASKENRLAAKAREVIAVGEDFGALVALIEQGAALVIYERDPAHPRSRYFVRHLIEGTYETQDFVQPPKKEVVERDGVKIVSETIALFQDESPKELTPKVCVRLEMFRYLLSRGATGGSDNWRGGFFESVLRNAFWNHASESHFAFAKELVSARPEMLARAALHSYDWHANMEAFEVFLRLGGDPATPGTLENALRYVDCASDRHSTKGTRADVIRALIAKGARLTEETREQCASLAESRRPRSSECDALWAAALAV